MIIKIKLAIIILETDKFKKILNISTTNIINKKFKKKLKKKKMIQKILLIDIQVIRKMKIIKVSFKKENYLRNHYQFKMRLIHHRSEEIHRMIRN